MGNHTVECDDCGWDLRGLGGGHAPDCPSLKHITRLPDPDECEDCGRNLRVESHQFDCLIKNTRPTSQEREEEQRRIDLAKDQAINQTTETIKVAHDWFPSTIGHGELQCSYCLATNREIAVIGDANHCPDRALKLKAAKIEELLTETSPSAGPTLSCDARPSSTEKCLHSWKENDFGSMECVNCEALLEEVMGSEVKTIVATEAHAAYGLNDIYPGDQIEVRTTGESAPTPPQRIWMRDLDGTGSMHPCRSEDPGAVPYVLDY